MRYYLSLLLFLVVGLVCLFGLRGRHFSKPPLYIFPDMDWQAKYLPQSKSNLYSNGMTDRQPVLGTQCRGYAWDNKAIFSADWTFEPAKNEAKFTGKDASGDWVTEFPVPVTAALMAKGQKSYAITCNACHGASGDGNGITKSYGMSATASYHDDRLRQMAVGEIYNTITHGKGVMMGYYDKLTVEERWGVVAYVRALQRSQYASIQDVPQEMLKELEL